MHCDDCQLLIRQQCAGLSDAQYSRLSKFKKHWSCPNCISRSGKLCTKSLHWSASNQVYDPSLHSLQLDIRNLKAELNQNKLGYQTQYCKLASELDSLSYSMLAKIIYKDQEVTRLAGLSTQIKPEIHDLSDQLARFTFKFMKLENDIYFSMRRTLLEFSDVTNCQRNLVFKSIPDDRSSPTCHQRPAFFNYILQIFHLLNLQFPFHFIKPFKLVGVTR